MKGKKRQSKRLTLKKKYKILRKVREHKRKVRKDAKTKARKGSKKEQDPGIPNNYPFKAEALAALEQLKLQEEREKELEKLQRAKLAQAKRQQAIEKRRKEQEELRLKQEKFELRGSKRKIYGRCRDVAEEADIIVEVLDARDPLGCISPEVEKWIRLNYPDKLFVRLLNKIDLVPKEVVPRWLSYLRSEQPALAFKCPVKKKQKKVKRRGFVVPDAEPVTHRLTPNTVLGLENLTQLCANYASSFDDGRTVTIGIVGWPGVGKSSVLEQLKTLTVKTIPYEEGEDFHIADNVRVLDFVGLIIPSSDATPIELSLRNCMPADNVPNPIGAVDKILSKVSKEQILETYKIGMFENVMQFLELVAKKGGKIAKGGKPNVTAAAKQVIKDWTSGKIKFFTEPPAATTTTSGGDWREKVKMVELQRGEEETIYPLLKGGALHTFTSYGNAQVFTRKVEEKFLNFLEGRLMEEEAQEEEDGMDEVKEDDDEDEEEEEEEVKGKGKEKVQTRARKAKQTAKGGMELEGDFDFATDFVATSDVALAGGVAGDDEESDDDYEGEEEEEEDEEDEAEEEDTD